MARTRAVARRCTGGVHEGKVKQNARSPIKSPPQSPEAEARHVDPEPKEAKNNLNNLGAINEVQCEAGTSTQNETNLKNDEISLNLDESDDSSEEDSDVEAMAKAAASNINILYSDDSSSEDDDPVDDESDDNNQESSLFVIDKAPGARSGSECYKSSVESVVEKPPTNVELSHIKKDKMKIKGTIDKIKLASEIECSIDTTNLYVDTDTYMKPVKQNKSLTDILLKSNRNKDIMAKSVVQADFEKREATPVYTESRNQQVKARRAEREKTKGSKWFNMPAPELTEEVKNDLTVLQMRKVLDPKRFYKGNDTRSLPKYFQMGTVVESSADFYHSRIAKKDRKATMVDELLADAEFRKYNKRKYAELQEATQKSRGAFKHAKRLKKKKK
ncbi:unnamed protein product [Owenia fusiformis]|uniref:Uncharacterized protein n=1 Tax=Owenia fusiformis TaxID=6347 RepID=A0A8J1UL99_OWEFU|nr:unnamed protein product [Owenia fusiformis]